MKKIIVFAGGGSKGAYEYGAWKALRELGETFDAAVGVSIGSINAGFYVQDDFDAAGELWTELDLDSVMNNGINFQRSLHAMLEQKHSIAPFIKTYFKDSAGADITPFLETIEKYADEEKFFSSERDYALLTVKNQNMQPLEIYKKDIRPGYYTRWITASCACFPAFPRCEIDGQFYLDGGYYDNLPIATALKMGADAVTAIDLNFEGAHPGYERHPLVKYLKPSRDLGSFLCFNREVLDGLIGLGYRDTMKAYGRLIGNRYFFAVPPSARERMALPADRFLRLLTQTEIDRETARQTVFMRSLRGAPLLGLLTAKETPPVDAATIFLNACELALDRVGADRDRVYSFDDLCGALCDAYAEIRPSVFGELSEAANAIDRFTREKGARGLISELRREDDGEEMLIALLLRVLYEQTKEGSGEDDSI